MNTLRGFAAACLLLATASAAAADSKEDLVALKGKVILIEGTYMPTLITFQMDVGTARCPSGAWLTWQHTNPDNNKAIYSALLMALSSGRPVTLMLPSEGTGCTGRFFYVSQ